MVGEDLDGCDVEDIGVRQLMDDPVYGSYLAATFEANKAFLEATKDALAEFRKKGKTIEQFRAYLEATKEARGLFISLTRSHWNRLGDMLLQRRESLARTG